ncbi:MAG TPA: hypothetical protein VHM91_10480 [Verrucomicrobiales bacterium]|jgi:hypothetical protein|nr:hypothetical protein [Verrucomicrobiales bacterium]
MQRRLLIALPVFLLLAAAGALLWRKPPERKPEAKLPPGITETAGVWGVQESGFVPLYLDAKGDAMFVGGPCVVWRGRWKYDATNASVVADFDTGLGQQTLVFNHRAKTDSLQFTGAYAGNPELKRLSTEVNLGLDDAAR